MANPVGRPSKYSRDIEIETENYLQNYKTLYEELIPTQAGLALHLGVAKATLENWAADENLQFLGFITRLKQLQERELLVGGLGGKFNQTITALVLSKHGYTKDSKVEHTGNVAPPPVVIEATYVTMDNDE